MKVYIFKIVAVRVPSHREKAIALHCNTAVTLCDVFGVQHVAVIKSWGAHVYENAVCYSIDWCDV